MILLSFAKDIKGNSKVKGYEDWIECNEITLSAGRHIHVTNSERETGQPFVSELVVSKTGDISSPVLFSQALIGKALSDAKVCLLQTAGDGKTNQVFMTMTLVKPIISHYSAKSNGGRPVETISINFEDIEYSYIEFSGAQQTPEVKKAYNILSKEGR